MYAIRSYYVSVAALASPDREGKMNIHEYQAKEILSGYDIAVPRGRVCLTADQVERAAKMMGGHCVVKAQIYAGGRGKAGGVKVVHHPEQAQELAKELFARKLVSYNFV